MDPTSVDEYPSTLGDLGFVFQENGAYCFDLFLPTPSPFSLSSTIPKTPPGGRGGLGVAVKIQPPPFSVPGGAEEIPIPSLRYRFGSMRKNEWEAGGDSGDNKRGKDGLW